MDGGGRWGGGSQGPAKGSGSGMKVEAGGSSEEEADPDEARKVHLNNEMKKSLTSILVQVTDSMFGELYHRCSKFEHERELKHPTSCTCCRPGGACCLASLQARTCIATQLGSLCMEPAPGKAPLLLHRLMHSWPC